jgi:adenine-specific DNA-methyltransferase
MNMPENNIKKPFNEKLIELLKIDSRFVDDEGELIKAAVIDRAWKIDRGLVKLLLSEPEIEKKFFDEIEGHWIFNINTFIKYISDKNFLANSYTRFRNKVGLNIEGKFLREHAEVSLVWPYKDCVLEGGQTKEEEKRKEIFFNEILAQDEIDRLFDPKVLTNFKRYTPDGEQKVRGIKRDENGAIKENLIMKGNNLLALHTLKTQFRGKVKLIYIDPPYNTGNDSFGYNDNFNHSSWLTFMKNRLEVGRELLRDDGVILVQIDDKEITYLGCLINEIYGSENFVCLVTIERSAATGHKAINPTPINVSDYIFIYAKQKNKWNYFQQYVAREYDKAYNLFIENYENGYEKWSFRSISAVLKEKNITIEDAIVEFPERIIRFAEPSYSGVGKETRLLIDRSKENPNKIYCQKRDGYPDIYLKGGQRILFYKNKIKEIDGNLTTADTLTNIWKDIPFQGIAKEGGVVLLKGKKPEKLLNRIIRMGTEKGDIVLDYHLGTGTTCAVAHKMERQYIGIEQLDYGKNDSVARLQNVIGKRKKDSLIEEYKDYDKSGISKSVDWQGGSDFIYCELMKYNEAFMDKIQSAKTSDDLLKIWKDIAKNSFLNWYVNPEMPEEAVNNFIEIGKSENGLEKQKKLLAELLNKNQLYVNLSEIDDEGFKVSEEDKKLNQSFYGEIYNG